MIKIRLIALTSCLFVFFFILALNPARSAKNKEAQIIETDSVVAWYSGTYVQVSWDHDAVTQVHSYNIYRLISSTGFWEKLNQEPFQQHVFVDSSVPRDSLLVYRVTAIGLDDSESDVGPTVQVSTTKSLESLPSAVAVQTYDKNNIITDSQLTSSAAMTKAQIQSFLNSQGSVLANYSTDGKTAAQHIYDNCQTHGISPYVVLVTLQKEKNLIKSSTANPNSFAMGWNTSDSSTADFANQVYYGTRQFELYYNMLGGYHDVIGVKWTVGQARSVNDGIVTAANVATSALHLYTPWIGQDRDGRNGIGGNYLFWDLWYNIFDIQRGSITQDGGTVSPNFVPGLSLIWPLAVDDRNQLGNDYAHYNYVSSNKYHTGLDLGVASGTTVRAAAAGRVVKIQENDTTSSCGGGPGTGCEDHGYGTTVIVQHDVPGGVVYTQYSHMSSVATNILSACGPVDAGRRKRRTCGTPVSVSAGTTLGLSGASCYGISGSACGGAHLHFEVKTFGTLGTSGDDAGQFGYTTNHPDQSGYRDPIVNIHNTVGISPAVRVQVLSPVNLRVGPGGSGNTSYRTIRGLNAGEEYDAIRSSGSTTTPNCPGGWYQIRPTNGSRFTDTTLGGQIPEGWVCADFVSGGGQCSTAVGQGTSGAELTAFQNAYNAAGGQSVLGCPSQSVQFNGFTSFAGTFGHFQLCTNGVLEYLANGSRAGQSYAVVNPLYNKWASFGFNSSNPLGYPIANLSTQSMSCFGTSLKFQQFEGGTLEHHLSGLRAGSVYEVHGAIYTKWGQKGFAGCPLGLPISDEQSAQPSGSTGQSGRVSTFEGGHIHWRTNASAAYETHGAIDTLYTSMGGSASWLGFPVSDEYTATTGRPRSDFEAGYITTTDGVTYQAFPYGGPGGQGTCSNPYSLTAGQVFNGNTSGGQSSFGSYGCVVWNESGPEQVHTITLGSPGTLTASLSNLGVDLDIFILSSCSPSNCLAFDNTSASANLGPGTYYLLVDGFEGAVGSYTLSVNVSGASQTATIGLYVPSGGAFYLRNANSTGVADIAFTYGPAGLGWLALVGDWDGNGTDTTGLYNPANGAFYLRNANSTGIADIIFTYGPAGLGWLPLVGDWDGNGTDTIGLYNPANGAFYLRNANSTGIADLVFTFGPAGQGWTPLVGDWNNDGTDTIGFYNPANGAFYLRNANSTGIADVIFTYGPAGLGWLPLVGDWNGDGVDTIGLYNPSNGVFYLRNANSTGVADLTFLYGAGGQGWIPLVGDWDGS